MHHRELEQHAQRALGCYGELKMAVLADFDSGHVLYRLDAPHVVGGLVLTPTVFDRDPTMPAHAGAPDLYLSADVNVHPFVPAGTSPLSINRVQLTGRLRVSTDGPGLLWPQRLGKNGASEDLPERTLIHARAVLGAVIDHWRAQETLPVLRAAAERGAARTWLARYDRRLAQQRQQALWTEERIRRLHTLLGEPAQPRTAA
ncbi:hypothetical protein [Streptomyces luteireticuli]|uniref:hypothetical protein n=1 Tax=Streptomyces luteireticuli TaxID=173858 RepID=UPI003557D3C0